MNVKGRGFVGSHKNELFAVPPCERCMLYQAVQSAWCEYGSARALDTFTPVLLSNMMGKVQTKKKIERKLI